jgi:glycosyltransferase involved in cell wall biosynthesis
LKVLHLTADWKWTGPAEPMLNVALELRALGHAVDLAFPEPPTGHAGALAARAASRGVTPVHVLQRGQGYRPLRDRHEVRRLRELLERERYDLLHVHHTRDHLLAYLASRHLDVPVVASWHRGEPVSRRPWNRLLLGPRGAAGLVVLTEGLRLAAIRDLGQPEGNVVVVPGSVDTRHFVPRAPADALRKELGLDASVRVIGLVARLQPHRRVELLLEALMRARSRAPQLRLLVIGRGTRARQVLEEPVAKLGLEDIVIRAGYRREDYLDVLSVLDALVFLVPGSDGSCRAVLESMAMGIPTIATRRGTLPETVIDGETGCLVDEDPEALADALVDLAQQRDVWRLRGESARRRVVACHGVGQAAERLDRFYTRLRAESV